MKCVIDSKIEQLQEFEIYTKIVLSNNNTPEDSVPVIWEENILEPPSGHFHQFSFDELIFLKMLYKET